MINSFDMTVLCQAKEYFVAASDFDERTIQEKVAGAVWDVLRISYIARKDGLLAMEDYANELLKDAKCSAQDRFFCDGILLVVDGTDPEYVEEMLSARILVDGADTFSGYLKYLIMKGLLCVQRGEHPRMIENKLFCFIPEQHREVIRENVEEQRRTYEVGDIQKILDFWKNFKRKEINHPFLSLFETEFMALDDEKAGYFRLRLYTDAFNTLVTYCHDDVRERLLAGSGPESLQHHAETLYRVEDEDLTPVLDFAMKLIQFAKAHTAEELWKMPIPI